MVSLLDIIGPVMVGPSSSHTAGACRLGLLCRGLVGHAVALAMQGMLGLVCDPLGGLVELPCVFRNATGSAIALAGIEMALADIKFAIPVDEVIDVMGETGREMDVRYRATASGGLAATPTGRRLARERLCQIRRG